MSQVSSNVAYSQTTRWVLVAVVIIALLIAIWLVRGILLLTLASVILVVLCTMPVRVFMRLGVKRGPAIVLTLIGFVALTILLFMVALPTLLDQFTTLATVTVPRAVQEVRDSLEVPDDGLTTTSAISLPFTRAELRDQWSNAPSLREQFPALANLDINVNELIDRLGSQLLSAVGQIGVSVIPVFSGVANTVLSILIVLFLSLYFLADPKMHEEGLIKLFPLSYRRRVRQILDRLDLTLRGWLKATLLSMLFLGVGTWLGLALMGIQQAAALGVLAGVLSFVPNFGPIAALIPALAVGLVQAPQNIGWIIVLIYGMSFLQSQVVGPLLVSESIQLPAVLVLLGQIIAGGFFGFLGIMLAVPMTAILMVLVQEVYVKDILGDDPLTDGIVVDEELVLPDGV